MPALYSRPARRMIIAAPRRGSGRADAADPKRPYMNHASVISRCGSVCCATMPTLDKTRTIRLGRRCPLTAKAPRPQNSNTIDEIGRRLGP